MWECIVLTFDSGSWEDVYKFSSFASYSYFSKPLEQFQPNLFGTKHSLAHLLTPPQKKLILNKHNYTGKIIFFAQIILYGKVKFGNNIHKGITLLDNEIFV